MRYGTKLFKGKKEIHYTKRHIVQLERDRSEIENKKGIQSEYDSEGITYNFIVIFKT